MKTQNDYAKLRFDVDHLKESVSTLSKGQSELNKAVSSMREDYIEIKFNVKELTKESKECNQLIKELQKENKEAINSLSEKLLDQTEKGKFDWLDFVKRNAIPALLVLGVAFYIITNVPK